MTAVFWTCLAVVVVLGSYEIISRIRFTRHNQQQFIDSGGVYWIVLFSDFLTLARMRTTYELPSPDGGKRTVHGYCLTLTLKYNQEDVPQ